MFVPLWPYDPDECMHQIVSAIRFGADGILNAAEAEAVAGGRGEQVDIDQILAKVRHAHLSRVPPLPLNFPPSTTEFQGQARGERLV